MQTLRLQSQRSIGCAAARATYGDVGPTDPATHNWAAHNCTPYRNSRACIISPHRERRSNCRMQSRPQRGPRLSTESSHATGWRALRAGASSSADTSAHIGQVKVHLTLPYLTTLAFCSLVPDAGYDANKVSSRAVVTKMFGEAVVHMRVATVRVQANEAHGDAEVGGTDRAWAAAVGHSRGRCDAFSAFSKLCAGAWKNLTETFERPLPGTGRRLAVSGQQI